MDPTQKEIQKQECINLCSRLISGMEKNEAEATGFFNGEILDAYRDITEKAIAETKKIRSKIAGI